MQRILLGLHRKLLAQSIAETMREDARFVFYTEYCAKNIPLAIQNYDIEIAVIEVPESGSDPAGEKLELCREIAKASPGCKLLLMCSEDSEQSKRAMVEAKQKGEIEDFVFYDSSLEYLITKLESMK
ncbi:MAG: hypothetical protein Q4A75_00195 [Peptostreptococcaceae bacterium]|nr:hypothetical protein [Peptostreptococcaceae bacterium]